MKLKQLINGGALAATVLTLGSAQAENPYDGVVFCKATIAYAEEGEPGAVSVTLPFTTTGRDGLQYTWWNLGTVVAGGVADSWHSEGGPGRFVAHNNGRSGAYIYLTSSAYDVYACWWYGETSDVFPKTIDMDLEAYNQIYGNRFGDVVAVPSSSIQRWRNDDSRSYYCLAFTRDMATKMPTWHMLNRSYVQEEWPYNDSLWCVGDDSQDVEGWDRARGTEASDNGGYIGAYMGYLDAGEYMPFDVKFWAPRKMLDNYNENQWVDAYGNVQFTFKVEAAAFPLWEHDVSVQ